MPNSVTYYNADSIAVIGMSCRFPGADNPEVFWQNLCAGKEAITFFSEAELLAAGIDAKILKNPQILNRFLPVNKGISTRKSPYI